MSSIFSLRTIKREILSSKVVIAKSRAVGAVDGLRYVICDLIMKDERHHYPFVRMGYTGVFTFILAYHQVLDIFSLSLLTVS